MIKKDIICFTMTTWEGDYMKTIVHVMGKLAANHRVLFVDYPFTYKDAAFTMLGKAKAPVKRMLGIESRLRKIHYKENELFHLTLPPLMPTNWIRDEEKFDYHTKREAQKIECSVKKAIEEIGMTNPIVINAFNPVIGNALAGKLDEELLLYYCYDEISAANWCKVHGVRKEADFMKKVDAVITTSEALRESKSQINPNTILVKNGVDIETFERAYSPKINYRHPVVGYMGSIDDRLDYDLLEKAIKQLERFEFHFVGRVTFPEGKQRLEQLDRVKFFGSKQPNELPTFLEKFDVGIIPFVKNEFTRNIYPLKINEYLAAGKPVVTTDFALLDDFKGVVSITSSMDEFIEKIRVESITDDLDKMIVRQEVARMNSWDNRVDQINQIIEELTATVHV